MSENRENNSKIHAYWIHRKIEDPSAVSGFFYARECTCSNCGKEVNMEKPHCPFCGAVMDCKSQYKNVGFVQNNNVH